MNGVTVSTIKEVEELLVDVPRDHCPLLFAHSEVQHGLTNDVIPMINSDQLNTRHHLPDHSLMPKGYSVKSFFADSSVSSRVSWIAIDEGGVLNRVTRANQLTRGKLMKQDDWTDWESSEFLQLDQYEKQMMFGTPVHVTSQSAVFNLVLSYDIKVDDGRKKARFMCDGSTRAGQVRVLDHTYASFVDHTSGRLFYSIAAV